MIKLFLCNVNSLGVLNPMNKSKDAFVNDWDNVLPFEAKPRYDRITALKLLSGDNGILNMSSVSQSQLEALSLLGVTSMVRLGNTLMVVPKRK